MKTFVNAATPILTAGILKKALVSAAVVSTLMTPAIAHGAGAPPPPATSQQNRPAPPPPPPSSGTANQGTTPGQGAPAQSPRPSAPPSIGPSPSGAPTTTTTTPPTTPITNGQVTVTLTGGFQVAQGDYGRPVTLIASMLGVTPDVFRQAFSGVTPSKDGPPTAAEAQANKAAMMSVLAPYGVTNDKLDQVANYYRFSPQLGQTWPEVPATAVATVTDGQITGITITNPGSGYAYAPTISIPGFPDVTVTPSIDYTSSFSTNGSIGGFTID